MKTSCCQPVLMLLMTLLPCLGLAQTFSYDGNRWYEIEVSIFSNDGISSGEELVIPEKARIGFPDDIRQLVPASSNFLIDFDQDSAVVIDESTASTFQDEAPASEEYGPQEKPADGAFTLTDFNRDPFIALGNDEAEFQQFNRDLANSPAHRLLYHAVWRQPVLNRVQSTAIFVDGGDQRGDHRELEGSLRFSYNINRVDVEAKLWLSRFNEQPFRSSQATQATRWQLPERPFPLSSPQEATPTTLFGFGNRESVMVSTLAFMDQLRAMTSNTLHYLDSPNIGMLVEIRPYQLPERSSFTFE